MQDPNLELDVERSGDGPPRVRVQVAFARGYTADGANPTISEDCVGADQLASEVERLKGELDAVLERGRDLLAGNRRTKGTAATPETVASPPAAKPHLDSDLRVADLMTREVRTLGRNDRLAVAEELMRLGRMRHAVVVEDDGSVVGVLSQRDIFFNALAWSLGQGEGAHRKALEACVVKDVMQAPVVQIAPDAPLSQAAAEMTRHKIGCLPVVDGERLVGILTEGDFLYLLSDSRSVDGGS